MSDFTIAIFVNPVSGSPKYRLVQKAIVDYLIKEQVIFTVYQQTWPDKLHGFTHIFLVGGDGTLNYFINTYPQLKIPISVFKAGTGNDFAWKLYGDASVTEQLQIGLHGIPHLIDAGMCNGRYFLNGVGIGFDGAVVRSMNARRKWMIGKLYYYWKVVKVICTYRSLNMKVSGRDEAAVEEVKGKSDEKTFMITIANGGRFGGNFLVSPQSSLNDGYLDFVQIGAVNVLERYFYLPRMKKGRHLSLPFVKTSKIKKLSITLNKPAAAHFDGELVHAAQFDFSIFPAQFLFRH